MIKSVANNVYNVLCAQQHSKQKFGQVGIRRAIGEKATVCDIFRLYSNISTKILSLKCVLILKEVSVEKTCPMMWPKTLPELRLCRSV